MAGTNAYASYTDEELIDRMKDGDEAIMDYLCDKYKNLVRSKAKSMFILGADSDDLIQEGMIGLFKAVRDYDAGRDASFATFASLCISRQMFTAVQASMRKKHSPLNSYVSLDGQGDGTPEEDGPSLLETFVSQTQLSPEEVLLDRERVEYLKRAMDETLSEFEKQALALYMTGMNYMEIAKVLGRPEKSTDNALGRAKSKVRELLKES